MPASSPDDARHIDAENVRRCRWPNLAGEELVARAGVGVARHESRIVLDGEPHEHAPDPGGEFVRAALGG